jgi:hypothetical protein
MSAPVLSALEQRRCAVRIHRGAEPPSFENARPWAQKFTDLATLAAIVYRDVADNVPPPDGWAPSPDPQDVVNDMKTSLYFEVWERSLPGTVEVAVVFRGTHEWKDWWSNFRWVTRFIPTGWDQYDLTRSEIVKVAARAKQRAEQRHQTLRIVTAGHSLGGGLAQHAAYAHPEIKLVSAFDPSPVTGFRSVPRPARDANRLGIVIDRVYERGEILAYVRTFLRKLIPLSLKDPVITEIRFNVTKGDAVRQHSMIKLARGLVRAAQTC